MRTLRPPAVLTWKFGVFVLLLTLISLVIGTKSAVDVNENTRCLAKYARASATSQQARADASAAKDETRDLLLDGVVKLILKPGPDPAQAQARLKEVAREYRAKKRDLDATRVANPVPAVPTGCAVDPTPTPGGTP